MARKPTSPYPEFFTATNLYWKPLLEADRFKLIITDSLDFLVRHNRIIVNGFVIMPNHMHLVWKICPGLQRGDVVRDLLKYTAKCFQKDLRTTNQGFLEQFRTNGNDRDYQFWERDSLSLPLVHNGILTQKLDYVHNNPVRKKLCKAPEDYRFSSALFYTTGKTEWSFLKHYLSD